MTRATHFRVSSLYFLIGLNVLVLVILVGITGYSASLSRQVEKARDRGRESCEFDNVLRESTRLNTITLAKMATVVASYSTNPEIRAEFVALVPELARRAKLPRIQEQPCLTLYPR